jgi:hypothetical protein
MSLIYYHRTPSPSGSRGRGRDDDDDDDGGGGGGGGGAVGADLCVRPINVSALTRPAVNDQ